MSNKTQIAKELTNRETCRKKLPTFYGSYDNYTHGLREVLNNSNDEINENFDNGEIIVTLMEDGKTIKVEDTGRGIPLFKENNYVKIFERIFAGTKTDGGMTSGTNGVGTTVLNYTSKYFKVTSYHDSIVEFVEYENGGILKNKGTNKGEKDKHGTTIEFTLDDTIYTKTEYPKKAIFNQIQAFSVIMPKIKSTFYCMVDGSKQEVHYDSFVDYFDTFPKTSENIVGKMSKLEQNGENSNIVGVINTQVEPYQMTYLNGNDLKENGTIYDGVISGARKFFKEKGKKYGLQDLRDSLGFIIDFNNDNVEYTNQTKYATKKEAYETMTSNYVYALLLEEEVKNPNNIKKMMSHIDTVFNSNKKSINAKNKLIKELSKKIEGVGKKPKKLKNCRAKGEKAELFICEGDSALSGFMDARDSDYQAGFAIRGKFINVLKANKKKVFENEEVKSIIQILGIGYSEKGEDLDLSELNFGNIFLLVDADPDGYSIACLLLNFFWKYFPNLLMEGRIKKPETPLFEIRDKNDEMYYAYSEEERDSIISKIKGAKISRIKGLGEQDSEVLWDTALNPETRRYTEFKVSNREEFDIKIKEWFGNDVAPRKELILNSEIDLEEME